MGMIDRYLAYAAAFEEAYASDDWSKLEPYFTEDAVYEFIAPAPFGGKHDGRAAVLEQFKNSVNGLDRRFDSRAVAALEGPIEKDGAVWMHWTATYALAVRRIAEWKAKSAPSSRETVSRGWKTR